MKTWFKRILIGLVVLVVVAVVGLAIFLLTFDPNAYKYKLEELVKERYDRTLTIDGEIELSLFPRIGLAVQGVSLSEAGSKETFASIDSTRLAVAVWPLLSNSFVVDHVAISGLKARVIRGKDGQFNFSNLVGGAAPVVTAPANPAEAIAGAAQTAAQAVTSGTLPSSGSNMQIDIAGLDLKDGEVQLQDAISGMAVAVTRINANTGRVTFNQPFDVRLTAKLEGGNPRVDANLTGQALLTLDPSAKRYAAQKLDLRVDGKLPGAEAKSLSMRGNLAFNGQKSALDLSALEVLFQGEITDPAARATNVEASVAVPKLSMDPHKSQLQIEKLAVRAKGGLADGPFEFAVDAPALNISPASATGEALTGRVRVGGLDASFGLNGISGNAGELDIKEAKLDSTSKSGERIVKLNFASPLSLNLLQRSGGRPGCAATSTSPIPACPGQPADPGHRQPERGSAQGPGQHQDQRRARRRQVRPERRHQQAARCAAGQCRAGRGHAGPGQAGAAGRGRARQGAGRRQEGRIKPAQPAPRRPPTTTSTCRPWSVPASTARSRSASWWCAA